MSQVAVQSATQPVAQTDTKNIVIEGLSTFGMYYALFGAVISSIIGVGLIIYGIMILTNKFDRSGVEGIVKTIDCNARDCSVNVDYIYNNTNYNMWFYGIKKVSYSVGSKIIVYVKDNNPTDVTIDTPPNNTTGIIILVVGIVIPILGWLWYLGTKKYRELGALSAVSAILN